MTRLLVTALTAADRKACRSRCEIRLDNVGQPDHGWLEAGMVRLPVLLALGVLMACGSGGSPPTAPASSGPTPVSVDYNGTYIGTAMAWRDPNGVLTVTASCNVSQTGLQLFFTSMSVSTPLQGRQAYAMGPAILVGNSFNYTREFLRPGCGQVTDHYRGSFSADGEVMTITMTYVASGCEKFEISGEMRRVRL